MNEQHTAEFDAVREAVAEMVRDHTMPPNKDRRGYDYRMGWWDAVTYLDSLVRRRVREATHVAPPAETVIDVRVTSPVAWCGAHHEGACHIPDSTGVCELSGHRGPASECRCGLDSDPIPGVRHIDACPKRGTVIPPGSGQVS